MSHFTIKPSDCIPNSWIMLDRHGEFAFISWRLLLGLYMLSIYVLYWQFSIFLPLILGPHWHSLDYVNALENVVIFRAWIYTKFKHVTQRRNETYQNSKQSSNSCNYKWKFLQLKVNMNIPVCNTAFNVGINPFNPEVEKILIHHKAFVPMYNGSNSFLISKLTTSFLHPPIFLSR
jgi:hypothetical protein